MRPCECCKHPDVLAIDKGVLAGLPMRLLAQQFGVSHYSIFRHQKQRHISPAVMRSVIKAQENQPERCDEALTHYGNALVDEVMGLQNEAEDIGTRAKKKGNLRIELAAVKERGRLVELRARLAGVLAKDAPEVRVDALITDDRAAQLMDSMMDRWINDPEQRRLLEQKLGEPAVETTATPVDSDSDN